MITGRSVISDTHVFSPTIINTFTFGRQTDFLLAGEEEKGIQPLTGDVAVCGDRAPGSQREGLQHGRLPDMTISGLTTVSAGGSGGIDNVDQDNGINTFIDYLSWVKGKHMFKFGGEYRSVLVEVGNHQPAGVRRFQLQRVVYRESASPTSCWESRIRASGSIRWPTAGTRTSSSASTSTTPSRSRRI